MPSLRLCPRGGRGGRARLPLFSLSGARPLRGGRGRVVGEWLSAGRPKGGRRRGARRSTRRSAPQRRRWCWVGGGLGFRVWFLVGVATRSSGWARASCGFPLFLLWLSPDDLCCAHPLFLLCPSPDFCARWMGWQCPWGDPCRCCFPSSGARALADLEGRQAVFGAPRRSLRERGQISWRAGKDVVVGCGGRLPARPDKTREKETFSQARRTPGRKATVSPPRPARAPDPAVQRGVDLPWWSSKQPFL